MIRATFLQACVANLSRESFLFLTSFAVAFIDERSDLTRFEIFSARSRGESSTVVHARNHSGLS
jgi:hypothetical protein